MREHLYSTNVANVKKNGGKDDTHYAVNAESKNDRWVFSDENTDHICDIRHFRLFLGYDDNVK